MNLGLDEAYLNSGHHNAQGTMFCIVAPNICGSLVWNFLCITLLTSAHLRWLQGFWEIYGPLGLMEWPVYPCLQCMLHVSGDCMSKPSLVVKSH
jgi:hypothetical protein